MEGNRTQTAVYPAVIRNLNQQLTEQILENALKLGIQEFCYCAGSRNSPLVIALLNLKNQHPHIQLYSWFEERSAAFFALGCSRRLNRPVAVITTSGTACGELLPATMEAYYTGVPLLLITADRPRRFRGSGAPQSVEQVNLFGVYTPFFQDLEGDECCSLLDWNQKSPAHLNICFEDPKGKEMIEKGIPSFFDSVQDFLDKSSFPFVVVSTLKKREQEPVKQFLLSLQAPVYLEAISGLREDPELQVIRIHCTDHLLQRAKDNDYPIDGVLRLGGVPTVRFWRDLEDLAGEIPVCNINHISFSGLSWADSLVGSMEILLPNEVYRKECSKLWLQEDRKAHEVIQKSLTKHPQKEMNLFRKLSERIPKGAFVYLGNSLPIREWDCAATSEFRNYRIEANRGANGIDGQISTFLGLCEKGSHNNWCIIGDLTALYDMAAPWVLQQMKETTVHLVVVNNGGGKIFEKMYSQPEFQNNHQISFEPLARLWGLHYEKWEDIPLNIGSNGNSLFELIPC